jgi:hypothetical protein
MGRRTSAIDGRGDHVAVGGAERDTGERGHIQGNGDRTRVAARVGDGQVSDGRGPRGVGDRPHVPADAPHGVRTGWRVQPFGAAPPARTAPRTREHVAVEQPDAVDGMLANARPTQRTACPRARSSPRHPPCAGEPPAEISRLRAMASIVRTVLSKPTSSWTSTASPARIPSSSSPIATSTSHCTTRSRRSHRPISPARWAFDSGGKSR